MPASDVIRSLVNRLRGKAPEPRITLRIDEHGNLRAGKASVEKADARDVRMLLDAALRAAHPPVITSDGRESMGAWIRVIPAPREGDFVFALNGQDYLCHYELSEDGSKATLSNERPAKQVWIDKADETDIRNVLDKALAVKYPREKDGDYVYVMALESVPSEGDFIFNRSGQDYRAHYTITAEGVALSEVTPVKRVWETQTETVAKAYKSIDDLPDATKGLPKHGKEIFLAAFNAAYEQYKGDEKKCFATAWAAVGKKYKKDGEKWVAKAEIGFVVPILKADDEQRIVYGIVAQADDAVIAEWVSKGCPKDATPDLVDTQGDWHQEAELGTACERFMSEWGSIGKQHSELMKDAKIAQCAVLQKGSRWPLADSEPLPYKTWVFAVKVENDDAWRKVKSGEITGFSLGGYAERVAA